MIKAAIIVGISIWSSVSFADVVEQTPQFLQCYTDDSGSSIFNVYQMVGFELHEPTVNGSNTDGLEYSRITPTGNTAIFIHEGSGWVATITLSNLDMPSDFALPFTYEMNGDGVKYQAEGSCLRITFGG